MNFVPTPPRWALPPLVAAVAALAAALLAPGGDAQVTATGRLTALTDTTSEIAQESVESQVRSQPGEVTITTSVEPSGDRTLELRLAGTDPASVALRVNRILTTAAGASDALIEPAAVGDAPRDAARLPWAAFAAVIGLVGAIAVVTRSGRAPRSGRPVEPRRSLPVDHLYAETDPESDASIAVHELAQTLLDRRADGLPVQRVVVAGTVPADRAAELATNLAIALAHLGVRVRLLDQDRSTTAVAEFLGLEPGSPGSIPLGGGRSVDCLTIAANATIPFASSGVRTAMDHWGQGFDVLVVHLAPRAEVNDVVRWCGAADAVLAARLADRPTTTDDAWTTDGTIPAGRHLGIAHVGAARS